MVTVVKDGALLLSVDVAAARLGIGRSLAWVLVRNGELPSLKLAGRRLVSVAALEAFVERLPNAGP